MSREHPAATASLRLAYADPPYPGQSKRLYGSHPDFAGEVDHKELVDRLQAEHDGWALSTPMTALRDVLPLCPPKIKVAIWHNINAQPPGSRPGWWLVWEPVLVMPARWAKPPVQNLFCGGPRDGIGRQSLPGQKTAAFCRWVFALLGAESGDEFHDLFPGTGSVMDAWDSWSTQTRLAV